MDMKKQAKNIAAYIGTRSLKYATIIASAGAAAGADDGKIWPVYAAKGAAELPAKLATSIITDHGLVGEIGKTLLDLADNVFESPLETCIAAATTLVAGHVTYKVLEHKRLKAKYA